jgi:hypothetical protein
MTRRTIKNFGLTQCMSAFLVVLLCSPVFGQASSQPTPQLSDAQAQALSQARQAGLQLTPEQTQMLALYMARTNPSAPGGNLTAAQMQAQTKVTDSGQPLTLPASATSTMHQQAMAASTVPAVMPTAASDKKTGVIRVGIVMPKAQIGQAEGPAAGEPLRSTLMQYLASPSLEVVSILALLPQQEEAEATVKQCDYLVYSTFTQKKSAGGLGFLKGAAGMASMASMIPMVGGIASAAGAIAAAGAATAGSQAAMLSSGITAKSQITMEYHVSAPGAATPVLSNTLSAKATGDGEDLITPLIEQEATAIVAELTKQHK